MKRKTDPKWVIEIIVTSVVMSMVFSFVGDT